MKKSYPAFYYKNIAKHKQRKFLSKKQAEKEQNNILCKEGQDKDTKSEEA